MLTKRVCHDLYFSLRTRAKIAALRSDGQLVSRAAFHESCSVRIVSNLDRRGINYRQKVGELLSEPESPANIRPFSYPITVLCWLRRKQRADRLYVLSDLIPLVLVKNKQLSNELPSHRLDA